MTSNSAGNVFSIKDRQLKLETAYQEEVLQFVEEINAKPGLEEVVLSGNSFGPGAAQAIAKALEDKFELRLFNASDIFTGRLREEIPSAVKAFCDALKDKEKLVEINFSDNAFGPSGAEPMVEFLTENQWFQVLKLSNVGLGPEGGTIIAKALIANAEKNISENRQSSLRTIIAGRNRLENIAIKPLSDAIAAHGTLVEVRLPQNGIRPEGIIDFVQGLAACKNLEILDLQDNTFSQTGSRAFVEVLPAWPNLKLLNIGDCYLTKNGGMAVAEALLLGHNNQLEWLNLQYNEIDNGGVSKLALAISTHLKNLTFLELSGNRINPVDVSIGTLKSALEYHGHSEALCDLEDMEFSDEEVLEESDEDIQAQMTQGQVDQLTDAFSKVSILP